MENLIKIHLKNRDDYKNKYNNQILSYDLSNYILEELTGIDTKEKIKFIISSDFYMDSIEKNNLVEMIRNYFGPDISETLNFAKKQKYINYILLLISTITIIVYSILKVKILNQFIIIFGWVLLQEVICNFLYKAIENHHIISKRKQIVNAKIIFEDKNKS